MAGKNMVEINIVELKNLKQKLAELTKENKELKAHLGDKETGKPDKKEIKPKEK